MSRAGEPASDSTCPECGRETKNVKVGRFCPNCYWTLRSEAWGVRKDTDV